MKTIRCVLPPHHHSGFVATCRIWTVMFVLTLTMHEFCHWPSIADMSAHSHCGDEKDERIGLSS